MTKSILILIALAVGLFLPLLDAYTFTLRPFLMILLFFSFLNIRIDSSIFSRKQVWIALLLPPVGLLVYFLGRMYSEDLGLTLLLMGLAPTAVITPVLAELMSRRVGYMVGAIIITHAIFALIVPLVLPWILGIQLSIAALGRLVVTIGSTIIIPLVLGQLVRRYGGSLRRGLQIVAPYGFALFLSNITVAAGSLSHYLQYEGDTPFAFIGATTLAIGTLMLFNFAVGGRISPPNHGVEGSLALGRKNTMLSIWIALEYINPLVVLGPMLYILLQNVFVAGQIVYVERADRKRDHNLSQRS
ncbi:hypothetical protein [Lewinella sp. IMCC34191]|uniref:hypothetical protein n=1 Tax=Lewinella sp. IMCC34191 TaxID=2259172 RepID=UPI001300B2B9|nr:hypothetical protein [Lewinella sp. IMCC34191]